MPVSTVAGIGKYCALEYRLMSRYRSLRAFFLFICALGLLAVIMAADVWWFDAAYVGLTFAMILTFSLRVLFAKWRPSEAKHVPAIAFLDSWLRWYFDDYPR
jgi:hypothetical protein